MRDVVQSINVKKSQSTSLGTNVLRLLIHIYTQFSNEWQQYVLTILLHRMTLENREQRPINPEENPSIWTRENDLVGPRNRMIVLILGLPHIIFSLSVPIIDKINVIIH